MYALRASDVVNTDIFCGSFCAVYKKKCSLKIPDT